MNIDDKTNFNENKWLSDYYGGASVPIDKFENIKNFIFFWSLFEKIYCNNNANVDSICKSIDKITQNKILNVQEYQIIFEYFKNRYTTNGKVNNFFELLNLRKPDKKEFVQNTLENDNPNLNDILKTLLIIVYRLRNNLFHGIKRIELLSTQIENFKITNELLAKLVELKD